jgi:pilus assembly protein Flp/PilA
VIAKWFHKVVSVLSKARRDRKGAAMAEYAILVAGVALLSIVAVSVLGHKVADMFGATAAILPGAHEDDNGALISGHLVKTKLDGTTVKLDLDDVINGKTRLGNQLGVDLTTIVLEP